MSEIVTDNSTTPPFQQSLLQPHAPR